MYRLLIYFRSSLRCRMFPRKCRGSLGVEPSCFWPEISATEHCTTLTGLLWPAPQICKTLQSSGNTKEIPTAQHSQSHFAIVRSGYFDRLLRSAPTFFNSPLILGPVLHTFSTFVIASVLPYPLLLTVCQTLSCRCRGRPTSTDDLLFVQPTLIEESQLGGERGFQQIAPRKLYGLGIPHVADVRHISRSRRDVGVLMLQWTTAERASERSPMALATGTTCRQNRRLDWARARHNTLPEVCRTSAVCTCAPSLGKSVGERSMDGPIVRPWNWGPAMSRYGVRPSGLSRPGVPRALLTSSAAVPPSRVRSPLSASVRPSLSAPTCSRPSLSLRSFLLPSVRPSVHQWTTLFRERACCCYEIPS